MKVQDWIFSVRYAAEGERTSRRCAIVGPARASTVEALLHLAQIPEPVRVEIRADETVRKFVDGLLDPDLSGYYTDCPVAGTTSWFVCIGSVHEVLR